MLLRGLVAFILILSSSTLLAFDEAQFASSLGLELVSEGHPYNFLGINKIYVNETMTRQMLVVSNVPGELSETKLLKKHDFLILEVPKTSTTYTSMALVGISEDEIKSHIKTTSVWKTIFRELNPFPTAHAEVCSISGTPTLSGLEDLQKFYGSSVAQGALKCMSSFLQGVWDSTGGLAISAFEGIKSLAKDPGAFWAGKVKELNNLKSFIMDFEVRLKELGASFSDLPAETKTMLICSFVGGIGSGVALSLLTGGAATASVIAKMNAYFSSLLKMDKVLVLMKQTGKLRTMPPEFFQRLPLARIPDSVLDNLSIFARHDLPHLITGAMQCAL
jgi:hypothetical protein